MPQLKDKYQMEEQVVLLVSNQTEMKMVGVPSYQLGIKQALGSAIASKTLSLLKECNCQESLMAMTFDATSSNTGHVSAAYISMQQVTSKALLLTACRHHIGEIILTHAFNGLDIKTSRSPDTAVFVRFQKHYESLEQNELHVTNFAKMTGNGKQLATQLSEEPVLQCLKKWDFCRDNYKEVIELSLIFLNAESDVTKFKKPGELH